MGWTVVGNLQSFRRIGIETLRGGRAVGWQPTEFLGGTGLKL